MKVRIYIEEDDTRSLLVSSGRHQKPVVASLSNVPAGQVKAEIKRLIDEVSGELDVQLTLR